MLYYSCVGGVVAIKASVDKKTAIVEYDKTKTDIHEVMNAIGATGYKPVGYKDKSGYHKAEDIKVAKHITDISKKSEANKCGAGKYGSK